MVGNLFVTAFLVAKVALSVAAAWDYYHQEAWGGVCTTGRHQSPIDIRTADVLGGGPTEHLIFNHWDYELDGELTNNGHTVEFTPFSGMPAVTTTTHLGRYKLERFHVHWGEVNWEGSEHRIDGRSAALEIHFVHKRVSPASGPESEMYAVVGVLANVGESPESRLIKTMPISHVKSYGAKVATFTRVGSFLPRDHSYYYYRGSLTTPDCDEKVQWFVMKQHITVSRSVLGTLRRMQTEGGEKLTFNYRDVQPLNGRYVYEHYDPPWRIPFSSHRPTRPIEYPERSEDTDGEESSQSENSESERYFREFF